MKIIIVALLFSSVSIAMNDPKNMSRETLEKAFNEQKNTIAKLEQINANQKAVLQLAYNLHYGNDLQRAEAKKTLNDFWLIHYLNRYSNKIGKQ